MAQRHHQQTALKNDIASTQYLLYEMHAFGRLNAVGIVDKMRNVEFTACDRHLFQSSYINTFSMMLVKCDIKILLSQQNRVSSDQ